MLLRSEPNQTQARLGARVIGCEGQNQIRRTVSFMASSPGGECSGGTSRKEDVRRWDATGSGVTQLTMTQ